jgi:hypothetical protein
MARLVPLLGPKGGEIKAIKNRPGACCYAPKNDKPCWVLNKLSLASPSPGELKPLPKLLEFFLPVKSYAGQSPTLANRYKMMQVLYGPILTWTRDLKRDDKKWNRTKKVTHNISKIVNRFLAIKSFPPRRQLIGFSAQALFFPKPNKIASRF